MEISCHGSPFITQRVLEDLFRRGCRPAEPGEFTRRAFLNGRIDLSQAEAVMDLISARSEKALAAANQQMRGSLGRRMQGLIECLVDALARIEAYVDFPEEDLPPDDKGDLTDRLDYIILETNILRSSSRYGELLRDGIKAVILGAPNAGKSSLLNRMVGRDRAIVSSEPGTTRDFLEERIVIGSHCVRLVDTAGFCRSPAPLEELGIRKAFECAMKSDLQLVVLDATEDAIPPFPEDLLRMLDYTSTIIVINKVDLAPNSTPDFCVAHAAIVKVSALTGEGIESLIDTIERIADSFFEDTDLGVTINARHSRALCDACDWLAAAKEKLVMGSSLELIASDLRGVLDAFGEIGGKIDNERVLDQLFATFCIGK